MAAKLALNGIITALVTPFNRVGELDEESLRELVRFQIKSKVNGLYPLGTTGMGPALDPDLRKRVAEIVVAEANHRLPVIVHVGTTEPSICIELAQHAERIGADAIASLTPFYYQPGNDAIIDHFRTISQSTSLPLLIYNIPRHTGNNVSVELLRDLVKIPNLIGIKDSSRDFSQLVGYLRTAPEGFQVINGTDSYLFSAFCAGASAGVCATANPFPEIFVEMYTAYRNGDYDTGRRLQFMIHAVRSAVSEPPITPLLEAMRMRGLKSGYVKAPLTNMSSGDSARLRETLLGILPQTQLTPAVV